MEIPEKAKALAFKKFGKDTKLEWVDLPVNQNLKPTEALIKVEAAGLNPVDYKFMAGMLGPFGGSKTEWQIPGFDYAGKVVLTGKDVTRFKVGDEVFGRLGKFPGCQSEYYVADSTALDLALRPNTLPVEEAAGAGVTCLTALAGLVEYGDIKPGTKPRVLIVGGSGGVGHCAVQMAKNCLDAELVVSVNSSRNTDFVKKLGADVVVEYDKMDPSEIPSKFPEWKQSFDVVFDTIGNDVFYNPLSDFLLKPRAPFTAAAPPLKEISFGGILGFMGKLMYRKTLASHPYRLITSLPSQKWPQLVEWLEQGKIKIHVAKTWPMSQGNEAYDALRTGRTVGKIILKA